MSYNVTQVERVRLICYFGHGDPALTRMIRGNNRIYKLKIFKTVFTTDGKREIRVYVFLQNFVQR